MEKLGTKDKNRCCEGYFAHLPQGFVAGLPALHDLPASELLGASSTPPRPLPAPWPCSAPPASPGTPGSGRRRNTSARWTGNHGAQTWRRRTGEATGVSIGVLLAAAATTWSPGQAAARVPPAQLLLRGQHGGGFAEPQPGEGSVEGEGDIAEATEAVHAVVDVLPVGLQGRRVGGVAAVEVGVQDLQHLLIHCRLELAGEEGGSGELLEEQRQCQRWWWHPLCPPASAGQPGGNMLGAILPPLTGQGKEQQSTNSLCVGSSEAGSVGANGTVSGYVDGFSSLPLPPL